MEGKLIATGTDVSQLGNGIYVIRVKSDNVYLYSRLIKY